jgi:cytochrome c oxidase subunit 2
LRRNREAVLALALTALLGLGFWLFADDTVVGEGGPDAGPIEVDPQAAARGETLSTDTGCLACHTVDGTPSTGPTWKGLAGSSRPLASGETVTADANYLTLSIVDPNSQVVSGFDSVMPTTYRDQLSERDINDLVEYIQSLAG